MSTRISTKTTSCRGEATTICLRPLWPWPLTLKVVSESRVTWATFVPILVFLGLSVTDLGPMYATDVRQTDVRQHHRLISPPRGRGHNNIFHRMIRLKIRSKQIAEVNQFFAENWSLNVLKQKYIHGMFTRYYLSFEFLIHKRVTRPNWAKIADCKVILCHCIVCVPDATSDFAQTATESYLHCISLPPMASNTNSIGHAASS